MRIAFDCASFLWTAMRAGKDKENGREVLFNEKKVYVNSGGYAFDLAVGMMVKVLDYARSTPHECVLVFEGLHSKKRRQAIEPTYKGTRGDKAPEEYEEYQKAIALLEQAWKDVGAISMRQPYVEGDDVLGYLARNTEDPMLVATYDNDMLVLAGVNAYGAQVDVWVDGKVNHNKYGEFSAANVVVYKSLVGDSNDNIKGCPGFGVKTWERFLITYGDEGLTFIRGLLEKGSLDELNLQREEDPAIRLICDEAPQVLRSYQLARIHDEWVNNRTNALEVNPGMVKAATHDTDTRLAKWTQQCTLVTRANFEQAKAHCLQHFKRSPWAALDIETSTPPESDEWLRNQQPPNPDGVDVLGSTLTGLSITYGDNLQYTSYFSVDHRDTDNVTSEEVRQLVAAYEGEWIIQNMSFELAVLYMEWADKQKDNGYEGFLPRVLDTKMEASYTNENEKNGLKGRSKLHLGYEQQTFHQTTRKTGPEDELPAGGWVVSVQSPAAFYNQHGTECTEAEANALDSLGMEASYEPAVVTKQYKMNELTAKEVFGYGCDDTICTAALHVYYQLMMKLEHQWQVYLDTEIDAAYQSAHGFIQGAPFSAAKMRELQEIDDKTYDAAWAKVRDYLMSKGWPGSICPTYSLESKPADLKLAYQIVTGRSLDTGVRKPEKLAAIFEAEGETTLATLLLNCYMKPSDGPEWAAFNKYVKAHFKGEPDFNSGSPLQKQKLLYELLALPIRVRNKPTDAMRANGISEGSPKTDVLAIDWAIKFDAKPEDKEVLQALKLMQMVETRRSLYYNKYPGYVHWKTGRLHSSLNQCEANTRRSSESGPNKQQQPKHQKIEDQPARFREVIVPHHDQAVIVSLDEASQELRIIADYSKDPAMVACYVGDNKKDMHSLTGVGIAKWKYPKIEWSYEVFDAARLDKTHEYYKQAAECRPLGKKVNFTTEYGAQAQKVAETLIITLQEAEAFVKAKEDAFPVAAAWKDDVIAEARRFGFVRTMGGAVRHLRDALNSNNSYEASKADRQAVNFKVQGSAAEQTKRAYGAAWKRRLSFKYDAVFIGPIHDEVVWSVAIKDLIPFLQEMHDAMIQPYASMQIPIESSIAFGPSFGEMVEVGTLPSREAVLAGLQKVKEQYAWPKQLA